MDLRNLSSDAVGLYAAALLVAAVGWYTDNGGFLWAGSIFFTVASGLVVQQHRPGPRKG